MVSVKLKEKSQVPVIEVAETKFPVIDKNQSIMQAIKLMNKYGTDRVVVTDKGVPVGIMTNKDLMDKLLMERTRRVTAGRMHVSSFMSEDLKTIKPNATVAQAAKMMIDYNISSLPVVDDGVLRGLVTKKSLVKAYIGVDDMTAKDVMEPVVYKAKFGERLIHIRTVMKETEMYFMPVFDYEGKLVGTVSIDEIASALVEFHEFVPEKHRRERRKQLCVEDVMHRPPTTVMLSDKVEIIARKILELNVRGVIVLESNGDVVGVATTDSLTRTLAALAP